MNTQDVPYPQNLPSSGSSDKTLEKNMEIILSKLDAIRMAVQNLDHRITQIEQKIDAETALKHTDEERVF